MPWKSTNLEKCSNAIFLILLANSLFEPASQSAIASGNPNYSNQNSRQNSVGTLPTVSVRSRNQKTASIKVGTRMTPANPYLSINGFRNNLPPTRFDSFVRNAGAHAEHIYGDENNVYQCFSEAHRINTGISGDRDAGLTTGHGSILPDAWGRDEFSDKPESSQSGRRGLDVNQRAISDPDRLPKQDHEGAIFLDKENFYDEDRVRGADDPYNPYLATQEEDRKRAEQQVADAMRRYDAMNRYK